MLFLLVLCECGTGEGGGDGRNFAAGYGRPVRVSAAAGIPGCFVVGGERYGYFCELMEAYAENGGRELDFTAGVSSARMWNNLRSGLTDVGVAVSSDVEAGALSLPVRTTTYVMLAGRERPCGGTGLSGTVGSGRVVMPEGFTRTASYAGLLDSLAGAQLYISPLNVYELAAGLARGESDFLICEQLSLIHISYGRQHAGYQPFELLRVQHSVVQRFRLGTQKEGVVAVVHGEQAHRAAVGSYQCPFFVREASVGCFRSACGECGAGQQQGGRSENGGWLVHGSFFVVVHCRLACRVPAGRLAPSTG